MKKRPATLVLAGRCGSVQYSTSNSSSYGVNSYPDDKRKSHLASIDPNSFTYPKNPILANFFINIGRADALGSGVRNLYKFTKIYSGGEPELTEGDVFKTIVPLELNDSKAATDKVADKTTDLITSGEKAFLEKLLPFFEGHRWITNAEAREYTGNSESSVKLFLRSLTDKGMLEAVGERKNRRYRLA